MPGSPSARSGHAAQLLRWLGPVAVLLLVCVIVWRCTGTADQAIAAVRTGAVQRIERSLADHLLAVRKADGDDLVVSEIHADLEVTERDTRHEAITGISLGTSEAVVQAPVHYRYVIRLSDRWTVRRGREVVAVQAPRLRPLLPPAVDTAGMRSRAANGWMRFNAEALRERVVRSLTAEASTRAASAAYLDAAREPARARIEKFVRDWLLTAEPTLKPVIVIKYPDEALPPLPEASEAVIAERP